MGEETGGPERDTEVPRSHSKADPSPDPFLPQPGPRPHLPDAWLLSSLLEVHNVPFRTPGQVLSRDGVQSTDTESWLSFLTDTCCGLPAAEAAITTQPWSLPGVPGLSTSSARLAGTVQRPREAVTTKSSGLSSSPRHTTLVPSLLSEPLVFLI